MTCAPNLLGVRLVLNNAFELRADSRKSLQLAGCGSHDDAGFVAELKNLARIDGHLAKLPGFDGILRSLYDLRRRHEFEDRVKDCSQRGDDARPQQVIQKAPTARRPGRERLPVLDLRFPSCVLHSSFSYPPSDESVSTGDRIQSCAVLLISLLSPLVARLTCMRFEHARRLIVRI